MPGFPPRSSEDFRCFIPTTSCNIRVDAPNPLFARALQQAIGGVEGEIRVAMQYFFQACGARGNPKFRDLLMNTAAEELGHIEMLATAVAMNLDGAPLSMQEEMAATDRSRRGDGRHEPEEPAVVRPVGDAGGQRRRALRHVPHLCQRYIADMTANVAAESTGRTLAVRLYNMTDDAGMKDMLSYLIARDTMHQNQWLAALEELGGMTGAFPIPNSFPQAQENTDFSYAYLGFQADGSAPVSGPLGRRSVHRRQGYLRHGQAAAVRPEARIWAWRAPDSGAQAEQIG